MISVSGAYRREQGRAKTGEGRQAKRKIRSQGNTRPGGDATETLRRGRVNGDTILNERDGGSGMQVSGHVNGSEKPRCRVRCSSDHHGQRIFPGDIDNRSLGSGHLRNSRS